MRARTTIRSIVLVALAASLLYALPFLGSIVVTARDVVAQLSSSGTTVLAVAAACTGMLIGHVVRAWRSIYLFRVAANTTLKTQFGAFAVSALCNAVLPFRFGEFVRADVIAQRYRISYSFTFSLVLFERLVDSALLCVLACFTVGFYVPLAVVTIALTLLICVLRYSPGWFKRLLSALGRILDGHVEARMLFVFWSLEYGLRRTLTPRTLAVYCLTSLANWTVYLISLIPVFQAVSGTNAFGAFSSAVGSLVAMTSSPAPGALGNYSSTLAGFGLSDPMAFVLAWICAIVPVSAIGAFFVLFKLRGLPLLRPKSIGGGTSGNKLDRKVDVSDDQLSFLRDYYAGAPLARKVALDEIDGGPAIARLLTGGGSGAVTYLSQDGGVQKVTKTVPLEHSAALREQHDWLLNHRGPMVVKVLGEREDSQAYSMDLELVEGAIDCYEYIHEVGERDQKALLDSVVDLLASEVWRIDESLSEAPPDWASKALDSYLAKHIEGSLTIASDMHAGIREALACKRVVVNGIEHPNVAQLMKQIRSSPLMRTDLETFRMSEDIHGDLIMDNIVWSSVHGTPILLDPVPIGNFFDGPVFDFGKLSQSLQIGYEFMLRDTGEVSVSAEGNICNIVYPDMRSSAYADMWDYVRDTLALEYLTKSERRTMLFIGATNYLRRMKHQVRQCPQNAPKFLAAGVSYLDDYVRMFE